MKENSSETRYFWFRFRHKVGALCVDVHSPPYAANISVSHCLFVHCRRIDSNRKRHQTQDGWEWNWRIEQNLWFGFHEKFSGNKMVLFINYFTFYFGEWTTVPTYTIWHGACIVLRLVHINHCPLSNFQRMDAPNASTTDTTEICLWVLRTDVRIPFTDSQFFLFIFFGSPFNLIQLSFSQ